MPFSNLSGDPALDRWNVPLQHAVQSMAGLRPTAPDEGSALLAGAAAVARGTLERNPASGKLRLTLDVYDAATHRLLQSALAEDADAFAAAAALARALDPNASPLGARDPAALELWAGALNAGDPAQLLDGCRKLLALEPGFSQTYLACGAAFGGGQLTRQERREVADTGYANRQGLRPDARFAVGQLLFQSGQFQRAAEVLAAVAPAIPAAWNQVGYSQAMLGDVAAARKALEEYRKLGGDEANAVDSLGEAHYIAGKYEEAEKYFLECADKFPQTPQGRVAKLKAAAARALRGDRGGAEELARAMIDGLKKSGQDVRPLEEAWRGVILEQDPAVMKARIESSGIISPPARP